MLLFIILIILIGIGILLWYAYCTTKRTWLSISSSGCEDHYFAKVLLAVNDKLPVESITFWLDIEKQNIESGEIIIRDSNLRASNYIVNHDLSSIQIFIGKFEYTVYCTFKYIDTNIYELANIAYDSNDNGVIFPGIKEFSEQSIIDPTLEFTDEGGFFRKECK